MRLGWGADIPSLGCYDQHEGLSQKEKQQHPDPRGPTTRAEEHIGELQTFHLVLPRPWELGPSSEQK